ncbi:MAG: VOC family protein [Actinomycetota bacterium]|nr:VOC family protein [Actinomycetota bacterium]
MGVRRIVPNLGVADLDSSRDFYTTLLGLDVVMDLDWIVIVASGSNPTAQISLQRGDTADGPHLTIEVDDVDAVYEVAQSQGADVVYPITDEPWRVRRFFVRDPAGFVVNVMAHVR